MRGARGSGGEDALSTAPLTPLMLRPPPRAAALAQPACIPPPRSLPQPVALSIAPKPSPLRQGAPPPLVSLLTRAELVMLGGLGALVVAALAVAVMTLFS